MWNVGCILYEMITHSPVFPGDGQLDQTVETLAVLGTPSEDDCQGVSERFEEWIRTEQNSPSMQSMTTPR
jgi:serine/threonine protein kinase